MQTTLKKSRGRPATDPCPPEWLNHLRTWCDAPGPGGLTRFEVTPWGQYEKLLGLRQNKLNLWHKQLSAGGGRGPVLLTRSDYLRLCPLLAGWHQYEPPTVAWQLL